MKLIMNIKMVINLTNRMIEVKRVINSIYIRSYTP